MFNFHSMSRPDIKKVWVKVDKNSALYFYKSNIFCVHWDIQDKSPSFGIEYSIQRMNVADPNTFEFVDYWKFKDMYDSYLYESYCTEWIPWFCTCSLEKM